MRNISPGMVLEGDIKDQQGRILAFSGQEVTEKLMRVFKIWGIGEIRVAAHAPGPTEGSDGTIPERIRQTAEEITRYRFQYNDLNDPFVHELFRISSLRKARQLFRNRNKPKSDDLSGMRPGPDGRPARNEKLDVGDLITRSLNLGSIPDVYYKIITAINNSDTSLEDIAGIVSKDITLSAKVLQLVNSSFYSLRQKVDTLSWALALIGTNQLMTVVSGVSAVRLFKNIPSDLINMVSFWEHSIACGAAARLLSSYNPVRNDGERFFVAGLLHDIGRLILIQNRPEQYAAIFDRVKAEANFLSIAEADIFGLDHSAVGAELALHWNLPESLVSMIKHHHSPGGGGVMFENAIINLADIIVNALEIGNSGEFFVPVLEARTCRELALDMSILPSVITEIDNQLTDIFEIIHGNPA